MIHSSDNIYYVNLLRKCMICINNIVMIRKYVSEIGAPNQE